MNNEQLNRLLNSACEIITELEHTADTGQTKRINAMFNEIKFSDRIDEEMQCYPQEHNDIIQRADAAGLLLAMFKEYGESKYKEGVKDTTDKFATKTDDGFGNSILYGTGSSH